MFGQGNGAGRPKRQPFDNSKINFDYESRNLSWNRNPSEYQNIGQVPRKPMPSYNPQTVNVPNAPYPETSFFDSVNSFLGPVGGLAGGLTGLLGAGSMLGGLLGYNKLDLGRERNELGRLSGNFQSKGDDAWKFGEELRSGTGKFYDTARNEIGRQSDTMLASMRNSMIGTPSASAYRRNMGDLRRQMYEQMGSAMNQMYATGLQQSAQYGGLASDLWRNRIGAEQAIAQMLEAENKSANEPYGQLMNMGGSILGGLLGGVLG